MAFLYFFYLESRRLSVEVEAECELGPAFFRPAHIHGEDGTEEGRLGLHDQGGSSHDRLDPELHVASG